MTKPKARRPEEAPAPAPRALPSGLASLGWLLAVGIVVVAMNRCEREPAPAPSVRSDEPDKESDAGGTSPSRLEVLLTKATLAEAIEHVKPEMSDTQNEPSRGALLLGIWAAEL